MEIIGKALESPIDDMDLLLAIARKIKASFSQETSADLIEHCVKLRFIEKLAALLDISCDPLQVNVIWALANIASLSNEEVVPKLLGLQVHNKILKSMKAGSNLLKEQCLWMLSNIAGDGVKARDALLRTDFVDQLVGIVSKQAVNVPVLKNTAWAISNLCKGLPAPPPDKVMFLATKSS